MAVYGLGWHGLQLLMLSYVCCLEMLEEVGIGIAKIG